MDKVRENRLRRIADRRGLTLVKSRRRDSRALGFGRYAISRDGAWVAGHTTHPTMTLDDVEAFLEGDGS